MRQNNLLTTMSDPTFFEFCGVSFAYSRSTEMLSNFNWRIPEGSFYCIVGRSGCGKTTLLRLAAGLILPTQGEIKIEGKLVEGPLQNVGFVFQNPALLEWLPVIDNVLLSVSLRRVVQAEDKRNAFELLELIGIADLAKRYPRQLSGGQQSRVALARGLLPSPPALLMDEPFAALDAITREGLQDDLRRLVSLRKTTVLFVTHDIAESVYLGDQVVVMEKGHISHTERIDMEKTHNKNFRYKTDFSTYCQNIYESMSHKKSVAM